MNTHEPSSTTTDPTAAAPGLRVGVDIAQISAIAESLAAFGEHFVRRIFCPAEAAYARQVPAQTAQRLAARFAAKEAAMKMFGLGEAGIAWRDIEVVRGADGACALRLHRGAARAARGARIALSLSHDGDYAIALVAALAPH